MRQTGAGQIKKLKSRDENAIFNWLSVTGCALAACALAAALFFFLIGLLVSDSSGYAGVTFLPPLALALLGFALIGAGIVRERWRRKRGRPSSFFRKRVVDPSRLIRGTGLIAIISGLVIGTFALLVAGAGLLATVEYTESNAFCGEVCHQVMNPEATVYADSAHAQIACVDCHVGQGGDSYIRAKLNGLRRVYAIVAGEFDRPIPTPIHNRLPANKMCEGCHTRDRLIGQKAITRSYALSGEDTEFVKLRMMVNVGGGADGFMKGSGIHFHMLIAQKVEYVARDPQRQDIAWVRVTRFDGEIKEYSNEEDPLTEAERESLEVRTMECLDCHSRPAHRFRSPVDSVNSAIAAGAISAQIPYVKEAAVRALDGDYETTEEAMTAIADRFLSFYEEEYPEVIEGDPHKLDDSIGVLQKIYRRTIFPEMKADWRAHPNNIGHRDSPGCFRCHNDEMVSEAGEAVFTDCTKCHAILAEGEEVVEASNFDEGLAFVHPEDWETIEEFTVCWDCHTGGADAYE